MPDRDYYLDPSPRMAEIRTKYQAHVEKMLDARRHPGRRPRRPRGSSGSRRRSPRRTRAARTPRTSSRATTTGRARTSRRRRRASTGRRTSTPRASAPRPSFVVWQPGAVTGIAALVAREPLDTWKEYLTFRALSRAATFLPKAFVDEQFAFYGTTLTGAPEAPRPLEARRGRRRTPRSARPSAGSTSRSTSRPSEKARAEEMVKNEIAAFGLRIDRLDWMAPETKARAKAKLAALKVGVGYPDKWTRLLRPRGREGRRARQRAAGVALPHGARTSRGSASRSTAASGS